MKLYLITLTLLVLFPSATSFGQAKIEGVVVNDRNQPGSNVAVVVTPGGQHGTTDNKGHFKISLPAKTQPGVAARVSIQKPDWVVLDPLFGKCTTQDEDINREPLRIVIVRSGSPATMNPHKLNALVDYLRKQNSTQARSLVEQKGKLAELESQREKTAFLQEYADEYGVSLEKLRAALDEWAQRRDVGDELERARKAYWRGDSTGVLNVTEKAWPAAIEASTIRKRDSLELDRATINTGKYRGVAFFDTKQYSKALEVYKQLIELFETEHFSKKLLQPEWAEIITLSGNAKAKLAERVEGVKSPQLLREALGEHREAATFYTREQTPNDWAWVQVNLGNTLTTLGEQASGPEGLGFLREAIASYRAALREVDRVRLSGDRSTQRWAQRFWAKTQSNLGLALMRLAERVTGEESKQYLTDAVAAHRAALQLVNAEENPEGWVITQMNLAGALLSLGRTTDDPNPNLEAAVAHYRKAIEVCAKNDKLREFRIQTNNGLGVALAAIGKRIGGLQGNGYLRQALESYHAALEAIGSEEHEQKFAEVMLNLGATQEDLGARITVKQARIF